MSTLKKLEELKGKLETLSTERSKLVGRYEQLMDALRAMGVNSYEEGVEMEKRLRLEYEAWEDSALKLKTDIEEKFKGFL